LLAEDRAREWSENFGHETVKKALRKVLEDHRRLAAEGTEVPDSAEILDATATRLREATEPALRPLLNGTGVVLHTNLGRAPLAPNALEALAPIGGGYSNLELDLETGTRGSRYAHCAELLRDLTGSETALVVNNNAAAVALVVNEFALGREVIVSRGELVEIGGSFRIPDIVERAGGSLRDVGTTNRTRIDDYRGAVGTATGLILKVHPSNYQVRGFVEEVALPDLVELGRDKGVPVANDLGSGLLLPELLPLLPDEPGPRESAAAGADLVTWSGDKLLGGPQAGIIHGSKEAIGRLRANPLLRAFRVDKLTLAALEATLLLYNNPDEASNRIPALAMLRESAEAVGARAAAALALCPETVRGGVTICDLDSVVGGGAFPELSLASCGWAIYGRRPGPLERSCREGDPPLIGRIEGDTFYVDFRTILAGQEPSVARIVSSALAAE
jgi:L-seryl-tRNA(Ser) seleniumtransferase